MSEPFEPSRHITKLKGIDYLEVKWRLVWLRDRHPNAVIETELIAHDDKIAIFKATVDIPLEGGEGGGSATGFGSETPGDFPDYIEKAETKAIGRALAALGFGTQFAGYEDGASNDRPVDSPVKREAPRDRSTSRNTVSEIAGATQTRSPQDEPLPGLQPATQKQIEAIEQVAQVMKITPTALLTEIKESLGVSLSELNRRDASVFYERLQQRRKEQPATQAQMIDTTDASARARN